MVKVTGYWILTASGEKLPTPFASKKAADTWAKRASHRKRYSILYGTSETTKKASHKIKLSDLDKRK